MKNNRIKRVKKLLHSAGPQLRKGIAALLCAAMIMPVVTSMLQVNADNGEGRIQTLSADSVFVNENEPNSEAPKEEVKFEKPDGEIPDNGSVPQEPGAGDAMKEPEVTVSGNAGQDGKVPTVSDPSVTEPTVSGPSVSGPSVPGPSVSGPSVSGPSVSDPSVPGPSVSGPSVSGPSVSSNSPAVKKMYRLAGGTGKEDLDFDAETVVYPAPDKMQWDSKGEKLTAPSVSFKLKFKDDVELLEKYTLYFPREIKCDNALTIDIVARGSSGASQKMGVGRITEDSIEVEFTEKTGSALTVNTMNGSEREYKGIYFQATLGITLTPPDNSGSVTVDYEGQASGGGRELWFNSTIKYPVFPKHLSVTKKTLTKSGQYYKCTTVIKPGNIKEERTSSIFISETSENMVFASDQPVSWTSDYENITLSESNDGSLDPNDETVFVLKDNKNLTFRIDTFDLDNARFEEDDEIILTYCMKVDPKVFEDTGEVSLTNKAEIYKSKDDGSQGASMGSASASPVVTVTPAPITYSYTIDPSNKRMLHWTIKLNNDEIEMYNQKLTINIHGDDENYLKITTNAADFESQTINFDSFTVSLSDKYNGTVVGTGTQLTTADTITFDTYITDDFYLTNNKDHVFKILADLVWDWTSDGTGGSGNSGGKWTGDVAQPTPITGMIISKTGYCDPANKKVYWVLRVNTNKNLNMNNIVVTDVIPAELTLDASTPVLKGSVTGFNDYQNATPLSTGSSDPAYWEKDAGGKVLLKIANTSAEELYTIVTEVPDPIAYSNSTQRVTNNVSIAADGGVKAASGDTQDYKSELFEKTGKYDARTQLIDWKLIVNTSKTKMTGAAVEDKIPASLKYKEGSIKVTKAGADASADITIATAPNSIKGEFANPIDSQYVITYSTEIADLTIFDITGKAKVTNEATLKFDERTATEPVIVKEEVEVEAKVMTKVVVGKPTQSFAEFKINVNGDHKSLRGDGGPDAKAIIHDIYESNPNTVKLAVDPADMILTPYTKDADNNEHAGTPLPVVISGAPGQDAIITNDAANNKFSISLPIHRAADGNVDYDLARYELSYKIKAAEIPSDVKNFTISNTGEFECSRGRNVPNQTTNKVTTPRITVVSGSGGGEWGENYKKLTITKVDADAPGKKLAGAVFELSNLYGPVGTKTTDAKGLAVFDGLKKNIDYTIREIKAPAGYKLSDEVHKIGLPDTAITLTNEKIKASISFNKVSWLPDNTARPLEGAEFTLYTGTGNVKAQAAENPVVSDKDGKVEFEDVVPGSYNIKETKVPDGFVKAANLNVVMEQSGTDNNVTVKLSGTDYAEAGNMLKNQPKLADVILKMRYNRTGEPVEEITTPELASGTVFELYDAAGVKTAETIAEATEVRFKDVPAGTYEVRMKGDVNHKVFLKDGSSLLVYDGVNYAAPAVKQTAHNTVIAGVLQDTVIVVPYEYLSLQKDLTVSNEAYLAWTITVNDNYLDLTGNAGTNASAKIEDTYKVIPDSVLIAMYSRDMELIPYFRESGNVVKGDSIPVLTSGTEGTDAIVKADKQSGKFTLSLPLHRTDAASHDYGSAKYELKYILRVEEIPDSVKSFRVENKSILQCKRSNDMADAAADRTTDYITVTGGDVEWGDGFKTLTLTKKDGDTQAVLAGAEYKLTGPENYVKTAVTDAKGIALFKGLNKNVEYKIQETKVPDGYVLNNDIFTLGKSETQLTVYNKKVKTGFSFTKTAEQNNGSFTGIEGVEFTLYGSDGTSAIGTPVLSNKEGTVSFDELNCGVYYIKETKVSVQYKKAQDLKLTVSQKSQGSEELKVEVAAPNEDYLPEKGELRNSFQKADIDVRMREIPNGTVENLIAPDFMPGTKFELYDPAGTLVSTAVSDDSGTKFKAIPYGDYYIVVGGDVKEKVFFYKLGNVEVYPSDDYTAQTVVEKPHKTVVDNVLQDSVTVLPYQQAEYRISVVIKDKNNKKNVIPNAPVELWKYNGTEYEFQRGGLTNELGKAEFNVTAGKYRILQKEATEDWKIVSKPVEIELPVNTSGTVIEQPVVLYNAKKSAGNTNPPSSGGSGASGSSQSAAAPAAAVKTGDAGAPVTEYAVINPQAAANSGDAGAANASGVPKTGDMLPSETALLLGMIIAAAGAAGLGIWKKKTVK